MMRGKRRPPASGHSQAVRGGLAPKTIAELLYHDSAKMQAPIFPGEEVSSP